MSTATKTKKTKPSGTGTRLRSGDTVRVMVGKDKGKEGKVLKSIAPVEKPKRRPARVEIEGINQIIKHTRAAPQQNPAPGAPRPESGRVTKTAPVYASKVMLVCPNCGEATRIAISTDEAGQRYRSCKKCQKKID